MPLLIFIILAFALSCHTAFCFAFSLHLQFLCRLAFFRDFSFPHTFLINLVYTVTFYNKHTYLHSANAYMITLRQKSCLFYSMLPFAFAYYMICITGHKVSSLLID